jgi:hypothetical protein
MSVNASLAPLSASQMRKLHAGKPVRVRYGDAHQVSVLPIQHKKLMKAHMSGKGMVLQVPVSTMPVSPKPVMVRSQTGGNVIKTSKDASKALITAGSDRAVRAIEGSGVGRRRMEGGNVISTSKDASKALITAGSDRAVRAIEGSGMKQIRDAGKQFARGEPFKLKDGTAPMSVEAIQSGRPFGGKIGRVKKFNKVFKAVGQKLLPLNKNLSPIKKAGTARAVDFIENYNNPQAQLKSAFDLLQEELPQTMDAFSGETPVVYAEEVYEAPRPRGRPRASVEPVYSFPLPPSYVTKQQEEDLRYEPVVYYGAGVKKGSPAMKAKMAGLRAMKKSSPAPAKKGGAVKGSQEMKDKMARLRAMRKKKGGALYPAGYDGGAMYPAGY